MSVTDKHLIDYLSGDPNAPLEPDDREALDQLRALLADEATWVEPDPALEGRVLAAISDAAAAQDAPAAPAQDMPTAAPTRRLPALRLPRARRLVPALAAGLAAILAAVVLLTGRGPAPTQFSVILHATALAPGAGGNATLTKTNVGWRVNLSAHGLPLRKANGTYYQAWLKNRAGNLVPIGTFNQPTSITMWSGVSPQKGFTTLTVTRQRASLSPASSHQVVLTGVAQPAH
jgi:Anti-sigma-K factor rskA, C-terminal